MSSLGRADLQSARPSSFRGILERVDYEGTSSPDLVHVHEPESSGDSALLDYLAKVGPLDVTAYLCTCRACGMIGRLLDAHDCPRGWRYSFRTFEPATTMPLGPRDFDLEREVRKRRDRYRVRDAEERAARRIDRVDRRGA